MRCKPFQAHFLPHLGKMLIELGLMTEEAWKEKETGSADLDPASGDSLARRGLSAVVPFYRPSGKFTVYWPQIQAFTSMLRYDIYLNFPDLEPSSPGDVRVRCFMEAHEEGYEFGITVGLSWWEEHGARVEALGIVKKVRRCGGEQLVMEILPYQAFC